MPFVILAILVVLAALGIIAAACFVARRWW
jgi:hypothetical protein